METLLLGHFPETGQVNLGPLQRRQNDAAENGGIARTALAAAGAKHLFALGLSALLLLLLAMQGQLAAALILPGYYLADATITLVRRALNGEKVWQAHRKHFYQRAVQGGKRHDQVSIAILAGNLLLMGAAVLAASGHMWAGIATGIIVVGALLTTLQRWSKP